MAVHGHPVNDMDSHFIIDPITRAVVNAESKKTMLMQNDHNSERFTFEIDTRVEDHDLTLCNSVEVHYVNTDQNKKNSSIGVYEVKDVAKNEDGSKITFSWVVSENATLYAGTLNFLIRFACIENGVNTYRWNTAINNSISIARGMYNGEAIEELYPDILNQWKEELFAAVYGYKKLSIGPSEPDVYPYIWFNTSDGIAENVGYVQVRDIEGKVQTIFPMSKVEAVEGLQEVIDELTETVNDSVTYTDEKIQEMMNVITNLGETITPASIGAAAAEHTHTPEEAGAAPAEHSHDIADVTDLQNELNDLNNSKAVKSTSVITTLAADGWTDTTQTVSVTGVTASTNALAGLSMMATAEENEAAAAAILIVTAQAENSITITAYGEVPSIDIPIQIIILG